MSAIQAIVSQPNISFDKVLWFFWKSGLKAISIKYNLYLPISPIARLRKTWSHGNRRQRYFLKLYTNHLIPLLKPFYQPSLDSIINTLIPIDLDKPFSIVSPVHQFYFGHTCLIYFPLNLRIRWCFSLELLEEPSETPPFSFLSPYQGAHPFGMVGWECCMLGISLCH